MPAHLAHQLSHHAALDVMAFTTHLSPHLANVIYCEVFGKDVPNLRLVDPRALRAS